MNYRNCGTRDRALFASIALALNLCTSSVSAQKPTYVPPDGCVASAATAIQIAKAVLIPVYGAEQIASEEPFTAVLIDGVWKITGHFDYAPNGAVGGVAEIEISKRDGTVLRMMHGR